MSEAPNHHKPETAARITNSLSYHKPSEAQTESLRRIRQATHDLAMILEREVPDSRERSLAITNLEQAQMWANKALVLSAPVTETLSTAPTHLQQIKAAAVNVSQQAVPGHPEGQVLVPADTLQTLLLLASEG